MDNIIHVLTHNKDVEYNTIVVQLIEYFMFKRLLYMTALSFALVSSSNASASGKCIVSGCGPYNSSALMCNDISKCAVNSLNSSEEYSIANYNPRFDSCSNIINWISSSGSVYVSARLMYSNLYYLFYPDNLVRNKIMKYWWEKVLSSDFVSAGVTTISLLSNIQCVAGFANIPGRWTVNELINRGINALKLYIGGISIERLKNAGVTRNDIDNINANNDNDNIAKQELLRKWWRRERSNSFSFREVM